MIRKLGFKLIGVLLISTLTAGNAVAGGYTVYTSNSGTSKAKKVEVVAGGVVGAGIAGTFMVAAGMKAAAATGGGGVSLAAAIAAVGGGTAALTAASGGIALGAAAVLGAMAYGGYKFYNKYRNRLMGVSSETVAKIKGATRSTKEADTLINKYLKHNLDTICQDHGAVGVDMGKTKTAKRKTNLFAFARGQSLTAYDRDGNKVSYEYVSGSPHILVTKLVCIPQQEEDHILTKILAEYSPRTGQTDSRSLASVSQRSATKGLGGAAPSSSSALRRSASSGL